MPDHFKEAKSRAVRFLTYRDRSAQEVKSHLAKKEFSPPIVTQVIEWLVDLNYLNDERFARQWGRFRLESKKWGKYRLQQELLSKGLDSELVEETLNGLYNKVDEFELALSCVAKKLPALKGLDLQKKRRRIAQFLQRRGFSTDAVFKVLGHLFPY